MSVLSKEDILKHIKENNVVIEPFDIAQLSNTSYDVRLGKYFYRQQNLVHTQALNPFSKESINSMYSTLEKAQKVSQIRSKINLFENLNDNDEVILVAPNETILAHTIEFIGGKNGTKNLPAITTEMRARSSVGRIGIGVCKCAGWGDIGYVNRWTMEITNFSTSIIPLPVGLRIAQIIFHTSSTVEELDIYDKKGGKYQTFDEIETLKAKWRPEDMLPKLYMDKDIGNFEKYCEF